MLISVGSDHAGYEPKALLIEHLEVSGHEVADLGTYSTHPIDYRAFGAAVGRGVVSGDTDLGLCVGGTGIGISVAANKVRGVRAGVVPDLSSARLARQHNDADVICFGARLVDASVAVDSLDMFIKSEFQACRHQKRIEEIAVVEAGSLHDSARARL